VLSSAESDLSNDAYVNLISSNWGDEEGELRQAIFFQFIKKDSLMSRGMFSDDQERMLDRDSSLSDPGYYRDSQGGTRSSNVPAG